jgi:hypothetical protein
MTVLNPAVDSGTEGTAPKGDWAAFIKGLSESAGGLQDDGDPIKGIQYALELERRARAGVRLPAVVAERRFRAFVEDPRAALWRRAREAIGKYPFGMRDLGRRHDDYLAEDFER